jgi:hypothetical protein
LYNISDILIWNEIREPLSLQVIIPLSHTICNLSPLALKPELERWFNDVPGDGGKCFFFTGIFNMANYIYAGSIRDQLCFKFSKKPTALLFKLTFG